MDKGLNADCHDPLPNKAAFLKPGSLAKGLAVTLVWVVFESQAISANRTGWQMPDGNNRRDRFAKDARDDGSFPVNATWAVFASEAKQSAFTPSSVYRPDTSLTRVRRHR